MEDGKFLVDNLCGELGKSSLEETSVYKGRTVCPEAKVLVPNSFLVTD